MRTGGVIFLIAAMLAVVVVTGEPLLIAVVLPFLVNLVSSWTDRRLAGGLPVLPRPPRWIKLPLPQLPSPLGRVNGTANIENMLLTATFLLLGIGTAMVASVVTHVPGRVGGEPQVGFHLSRSILFGVVGLALMFALAQGRIDSLWRLTTPLLILTFLLLLATLIPRIGSGTYGSHSWIGTGPFALQPAELMKLALVLYAARALSSASESSVAARVRGVALVAGSACVLLLAQPNLGDALVVVFSVSSVLFIACVSTRRIATSMGTILAVIALPILLSSGGRARIGAFINPWSDFYGSGFQAVQGLIALGSGGLFGQGYGNSVQKAFYLPDAHTTFIVAVIGEELGAIGVCVVLLLFCLIAYAGLSIARSESNGYARNLAVGLTTLVVGQCVLNAYWVLGLAPRTDVGMPLVSYGSTSLLTTLIAIGVLINIARRRSSTAGRRAPWTAPIPARARIGDRRIGLAFAVFLLLLGTGAARALWLGTVDASALRNEAHLQQTQPILIPGKRGTIYDREGKVLVTSRPASDVLVVPKYIEDPEAARALLEPLLRPDERGALNVLSSGDPNSHYLLDDVSRERGSQFQYNRLGVFGVFNVPTFHRIYREGRPASPLLGSVARDGDGAGGLERHLDAVLAGDDGERDIIFNALGEAVGGDVLSTPKGGHDLQLTLDSQLQGEIEDKLTETSAARGGGVASVVVLDAGSGEVLAMGDSPAASSSEERNAGPTTTEAVGRSFEPGSAFDAFATAAALEESLVTPTETFVLPPAAGSVALGDSEYEEGTRLSTAQILAQSNDSGTVLIALRLGPSGFDRWMKRFGFGKVTNIELPDEREGLVPQTGATTLSTMGSTPIGRGASVTLIQLATAYATIANGGLLPTPRLISHIDGRKTERGAPQRVLSRRVAAELWNALRDGTEGEVPEIDRRTGTYSTTRSDGSFVGFVPQQGRSLVVAVFVEAPTGSGEEAAERLFKAIKEPLSR